VTGLAVVDASAVVEVILRTGKAKDVQVAITGRTLFAPSIIDTEVLNALRGLVLRGMLTEADAPDVITKFARMPLRRESIEALRQRVWDLHHNWDAHDASYIALAESLGAEVVTCNKKFARAPGTRCPIRIIA
jgi:predicted nucleic acid-binding protein